LTAVARRPTVAGMSVLIVNSGLAGRQGNSQVISEHCQRWLEAARVPCELVVLADGGADAAAAAIQRAQRLVFVSGTYWGGCSSLLQGLFERLTPTEASDVWLGKPAAVLVTAHQVGAQSVLFRLMGVLATLGCSIPPLSGVVISKVGEALRARAPEECDDVWGLADVGTALSNLLAAPFLPAAFRAWPVDREHYAERWLV
jgi:multimeric flavodoxin WrbA